MKKFILIFFITFCYVTNGLFADVVITFPADNYADSIEIFYAPIDKLISAQSKDERGLMSDTVAIKNNMVSFSIPDNQSGYQSGIQIINGPMIPLLYLEPGKQINVDIISMMPFEYNLSGSILSQALNDLIKMEGEFNHKRSELRNKDIVSDEDYKQVINEYNNQVKDYVSKNRDNERSLLALHIGYLAGDDYVKEYSNIPDSLESSIIYPLLRARYNKFVDIEKTKLKQLEMEQGNIMAPDFSLKDINGKNISLSDYKGKWVILDFWGSWCGWCIKGFLQLKEAYEKYGNEMVIIGIDCNDTEKDWLKAVEKYQLPWINLYNPDDSNVRKDYEIQVFPTKIIINPEGRISKYVIGEDPDFYNQLSEIIK
ncbi:MAG: TlpA family protein disulfide reductase [Paramuribaculum sp.]|nr:TlpA family protein disulfide reductase [Paramuribaculum sp.]